MRGHFFNYRYIGGVLLLVAMYVAIFAAATWLVRKNHEWAHHPAISAPKDDLVRELQRCQRIGNAAQSDQACIAAWAENRRRFFGGDK